MKEAGCEMWDGYHGCCMWERIEKIIRYEWEKSELKGDEKYGSCS